MKQSLVTLIATLYTVNIVFADVYELQVSDTVVNFASFCKPGKITVFEMSTTGCKPCIELRRAILSQNYPTEVFDFYYCYFINGKAKTMWGYCEGVSQFPVLYVFSGSGNPIKILRIQDENFNAERVLTIINSALKYNQDFFDENLIGYSRSSFVTSAANTSAPSSNKNGKASNKEQNEALNRLIAKLEKELKISKDSILHLKISIDSIQQRSQLPALPGETIKELLIYIEEKVAYIKKILSY